jgi:hypothetical protein
MEAKPVITKRDKHTHQIAHHIKGELGHHGLISFAFLSVLK